MKQRLVSEGHLIDSGILSTILNLIIAEGADYEIVDFQIGKTNQNVSRLEIDLICEDRDCLATLTDKLVQQGCYEKGAPETVLQPAPKDGSAPDDFYSTTNHRTEVFTGGKWQEVSNQRMDAVIVVEDDGPVCKKLRDIKAGDKVVCSSESVRVFPPERSRTSDIFSFMTNNVSSERAVDVTVGKIAEEMQNIRQQGGKVIAVAGPVVVHTGGSPTFSALLREGYINGVLSGNALAVHDLEYQLYGTSLGIDLRTGETRNQGHKNHMRAINRINYYGSIAGAIEAGEVDGGIMYELVRNNIPYCLAGSIRDDGPLPETEADIIKAQNRYTDIIRDASMVLMLSTMLHSIGTGNMLPSWVKTVCVDINPAVVTKLADRGSSQTIGIVSDVGLFLRVLSQRLLQNSF
jgi:lysine-ketoglutarate reductase/saccharopine dehydrogenase-like protein (TIGR00300 family)